MLPALVPPPVEWVGIPTRNRPETLRQTLAGHLEQERAAGRRRTFLVLDDSPAAATRAHYQAVVAELNVRFGHEPGGVAVTHVDGAARERWAARLAREAELPRVLVDFGLFGWPEIEFAGGANQNAYLLHLAGRMGMSLDDDVSSDLAQLPGSDPGPWEASDRFDPTECRFPGDPDSVEALVERWSPGEGACDLLSRPLGQNPAELLTPAQAGAEASRVVLTMLGLRGDSGMSNPVYLLKLAGASRDSLLGSGGEDACERHLAGRQLARGVLRPTLTEPGYFQGYAFGVDHRRCLPPAMPCFRGHDSMHAQTIRALDPAARMAHLPQLVAHRPPQPRTFDLRHVTGEAARTALIHWYSVMLRIYRQQRTKEKTAGLVDPGPALESLGELFGEIGRQPVGDAGALLGAWLRPEREQELAAIEALLAEHRRQPPAWARLLERYAESIRENLRDPWFFAPVRTFDRQWTPLQATQEGLRFLREFGLLLQYWPRLFAAALALRERGITLGSP